MKWKSTYLIFWMYHKEGWKLFERKAVQGTISVRRRGRQLVSSIDNIKTWTRLAIEATELVDINGEVGVHDAARSRDENDSDKTMMRKNRVRCVRYYCI